MADGWTYRVLPGHRTRAWEYGAEATSEDHAPHTPRKPSKPTASLRRFVLTTEHADPETMAVMRSMRERRQALTSPSYSRAPHRVAAFVRLVCPDMDHVTAYRIGQRIHADWQVWRAVRRGEVES